MADSVGALVGQHAIYEFINEWRSIVPPHSCPLRRDVPVMATLVWEINGTRLRELGLLSADDVTNTVLLLRSRQIGALLDSERSRPEPQAVILVPDDVVCARGCCGDNGQPEPVSLRRLPGSHPAARPFDVRFLGAASKPGIELGKVCAACEAVHTVSEVRWKASKCAQSSAALEGGSLLQQGEQVKVSRADLHVDSRACFPQSLHPAP